MVEQVVELNTRRAFITADCGKGREIFDTVARKRSIRVIPGNARLKILRTGIKDRAEILGFLKKKSIFFFVLNGQKRRVKSELDFSDLDSNSYTAKCD